MDDVPFVLSIVMHSNMFYSPVWPLVYPEEKTARLYRGYVAGDYLIRHQIESGHSFGVFDLEYKFKREESKPNGKLYWDMKTTSLSRDELLDQMDFPLVSVAMAYDGINALDMEKIMPLIEALPLFGTVYHVFEEKDLRPAESWKPTAAGQVLLRNATSSRHDAEGKGIMRKLAQWEMRYAHELGFRGIQIECLADQVANVWSNPPPPFKSTVVCAYNVDEVEEEVEVDGVKKKVKAFGDDCHQMATKVYCNLRPNEANGHANGVAGDPAVGALG